MKPPPGPPPTPLSQLVRAEDRLSFLYVERATIHRDGNALTVTDEHGVAQVPSAALGVLMLGPGTRVTHQAMVLVGDSGSTVVWVGERGVRYYCHGRPLSASARLIERQARLVSNQRSRLAVARAMYAMRFQGEDVASLTMQQLRGREGARVRDGYRRAAEEAGIAWRRRDYDREDFAAGDVANRALSAATACLYGVAHAVIVALGASPALGFVHTGHARAFVYDVADLYKMEIAVPAAFEAAAECDPDDDVGAVTRRLVRDRLVDGRLLHRCSRDVKALLESDDGAADESDSVQLWDGADRVVEAGRDYGDNPPW